PEHRGPPPVRCPEHLSGLSGSRPPPPQSLPYIPPRPSRVRLGPATVVLPLNQPLRVAEEFASLDLLSNGRAIFCAGRGYDRREYDAFDVPLEESRERFDEELVLVRKALTEERFTFEGKFHRVSEPLTVYPRPVQQPFPMYVACFSPPTVEMAAGNGYHGIFAPFAAAMMFGSLQAAADEFRRLAHEDGHDARVMCSYFFALADNPAEQLRNQERLLLYLRSVLPAILDRNTPPPPHLAYMAHIGRRRDALPAQELGERSSGSG